jgi:hypothetical protein
MSAVQTATDPDERALRETGKPAGERALAIGMLIFSLVFCAIVFHAGWTEISAYEKCGLSGALTAGRSCPTATTIPAVASRLGPLAR